MYKILKGIMGKKLLIILFFSSFLGGCTAPTAMLGPAYTLSSGGNVIQTGFSFGSGELVKMYTGKTPLENIQEIGTTKETNIKKETLESEDFYILVKTRIEETSNILNLSNQ
tara:strand:+ start:673 stop:1008 length:336 start_codon:yes stop_codon:yes gene_type:complete